MLSSWLLQMMFVPSGRSRTRFTVSLPLVSKTRSKSIKRRDSPDLDVAAAVVLCPYAEDVFATPDAQHDATDLLSRLTKLVANDCHEQLLPVAICHTLLKAHDPLAAPLVLLVLPDRPYAVLEQVVVADCG